MGNLGFQEILLILVACIIIPFVFYLITLQRALEAVSRENRKMEPGLVWLLFIPLFNFVWIFFVVDAIGISFKREYERYGVFMDRKPTYDLGLAMSILKCCTIIPLLGTFAGLGNLVCWIVYWIKVNEHKNEIINLHNNSRLETDKTSIFS